ncbi:MAG: histidine phosphatase family protein [Paracoccaceae bacterium]
MAIARYLSHPQVIIDPDRDVQRWSLNDVGAARVDALARSGALLGTTRILCSDETKAIETATPLANSLQLKVEIIPNTHENDRSATGYLPPEAFEALADAFFAHPDTAQQGWETARAAQMRITQALFPRLQEHQSGDVLIVGHGAVGTLLRCALSNASISRTHDQPAGGGNWFGFDLPHGAPHTSWQPMERLV